MTLSEREVTMALRALGCSAPAIEDRDALPSEPDLYSLSVRSAVICDQLGLSDVDGEDRLCDRPLYLGKSESSVRARVYDTHFAIGKTGQSTVRRTFAALLGLPGIARPSKLLNPTPKQMMQRTANFSLNKEDDAWLSAWMAANIEIRGVRSACQPLGSFERAVGARLRPPLDQEIVPLWEPNPWRDPVAAAREHTRRDLRVALGMAAV